MFSKEDGLKLPYFLVLIFWLTGSFLNQNFPKTLFHFPMALDPAPHFKRENISLGRAKSK
jgi:hypothetical protein